MSPLLISSLRRPPTPATFDSSSSGNVARALLQRVGSFTSYAPLGDLSDGDDVDYDDMPPLEPMDESDDDAAPPSTQSPPRSLDLVHTLPTIEEGRHREWHMEQFICFMYRETAIWLRVTVVMEDTGGDYATPRVEVRSMTRFGENDPALLRIGLIIEHELQEGMRREILSAIHQAVRVRLEAED